MKNFLVCTFTYYFCFFFILVSLCKAVFNLLSKHNQFLLHSMLQVLFPKIFEFITGISFLAFSFQSLDNSVPHLSNTGQSWTIYDDFHIFFKSCFANAVVYFILLHVIKSCNCCLLKNTLSETLLVRKLKKNSKKVKLTKFTATC